MIIMFLLDIYFNPQLIHTKKLHYNSSRTSHRFLQTKTGVTYRNLYIVYQVDPHDMDVIEDQHYEV